MTDLEKAKEIFYSEDYSFVLVKNEDIISSSQKGIMQIVELIEKVSATDAKTINDVVGEMNKDEHEDTVA